jgi:hypothetical protein
MVSKKMIFIGGGLVAAILLGATLLLGTGGNSMPKQLQHLSLRIRSLEALTESKSVKKNIQNEELSQITTELRLSLTSSMNELTPLMVAAGMPAQFDNDVVASEADISTTAKLDEAALNNKFDRIYAETLSQKIIALRALNGETFRLTKNINLRKALITLDSTLGSTKKRVDALSL